MKREHQEAQIESALAEYARLREENERLRQLLSEHNIINAPPLEKTASAGLTIPGNIPPPVNNLSDPDAKITLFRTLFRGREDVFAVRWEGLNGRHGYLPKADRDWKAYLGSKLEDRKRIDRKTRKLWPLTNEVIRAHLAGEHTIGIYPLLPEETCWFLAVDFDKKRWQLDAVAFLQTCRKMGASAIVCWWANSILFRLLGLRDNFAVCSCG